MKRVGAYTVAITEYVVVEAMNRDQAMEAAKRYYEDGGVPDWKQTKAIRPATLAERRHVGWIDGATTEGA